MPPPPEKHTQHSDAPRGGLAPWFARNVAVVEMLDLLPPPEENDVYDGIPQLLKCIEDALDPSPIGHRIRGWLAAWVVWWRR